MSHELPESTLLCIEDALVRDGYALVPQFLDTEAWRQLLDFCLDNQARGNFSQAAVGQGAAHGVRPEIRQDETLWLERGDHPSFARWHDTMMNLAQALNRGLYLGLYEYQAHLACYAPGAFYARHLDRHNGQSNRILTAILYLNENWSAEDGGELRLYLDAAGEKAVDVLPEGGTLALFLSDRFPHEVRPARRARYSLSGWFSARPAIR